ncbi:MAG: hypothetical protein EBX52_02435 [Proteobacteria bacterium]|nr:hypothetical protein [Pseudomonadota bacterium]
MRIVSHRGFWKAPSEKNSFAAFHRAVELGVGIETDVRDHLGELVISHDLPQPSKPVSRLRELLAMCEDAGATGTLALNIKADGLQSELCEMLSSFARVDAFVFDMSIPDSIGYRDRQIPFFTRQSEFERECCLYEAADGVWLDAFERDWYDIDLIEAHLRCGKKVCIVSPELHGREPAGLWKRLRSSSLVDSDSLLLCTDFPDQAMNAFDN